MQQLSVKAYNDLMSFYYSSQNILLFQSEYSIDKRKIVLKLYVKKITFFFAEVIYIIQQPEHFNFYNSTIKDSDRI